MNFERYTGILEKCKKRSEESLDEMCRRVLDGYDYEIKNDRITYVETPFVYYDNQLFKIVALREKECSGEDIFEMRELGNGKYEFDVEYMLATA